MGQKTLWVTTTVELDVKVEVFYSLNGILNDVTIDDVKVRSSDIDIHNQILKSQELQDGELIETLIKELEKDKKYNQ